MAVYDWPTMSWTPYRNVPHGLPCWPLSHTCRQDGCRVNSQKCGRRAAGRGPSEPRRGPATAAPQAPGGRGPSPRVLPDLRARPGGGHRRTLRRTHAGALPHTHERTAGRGSRPAARLEVLKVPSCDPQRLSFSPSRHIYIKMTKKRRVSMRSSALGSSAGVGEGMQSGLA